jgi:hypothetical protein
MRLMKKVNHSFYGRPANSFPASFAVSSINSSSAGGLPNGGFEVWPDNCTVQSWSNNNICGLAPVVTKSTDARTGSFAIRLEVVSVFGDPWGPILASGSPGFSVSKRYQSLNGFYKYSPVGSDEWAVLVTLKKGEVEIGSGAAAFPAAKATYTPFAVNFTYTTADVPDRAEITFLILGPVTGSDHHTGTSLLLDDLSFAGGEPAPEPRLSIARNGNLVVVSWPAEVIGFTLQQSSSLTSGAWENVTGLTNNDRSFSFTPTTQGYFRLFHP